jgi:hypothetical protein
MGIAVVPKRAAELDLVYDRLIAAEKLKRGSKYERLAAVVFADLEGRDTVHDLRLRGGSGVRHQIDVTVGPDPKRLLVECKQYDKTIGLGIVRDFFGAVEDLQPDAAYVVTDRSGDPAARGRGRPRGCDHRDRDHDDSDGVLLHPPGVGR